MGLLKRIFEQALPDPIAEEARTEFKRAYMEGRCRAVFGAGTDGFRSCLRSRPLERQAETASQRWIRALVPGTLPPLPPEEAPVVRRVRRRRGVEVAPQYLFQMAQRDGDLMGVFDVLKQEEVEVGNGLIRKTLVEQFDVDNDGLITRPGKFEGEFVFVPYYYDRWLEGFADDETERLGNPVAIFRVTDEEKIEFPDLGDATVVKIMERDDGFVVLLSSN